MGVTKIPWCDSRRRIEDYGALRGRDPHFSREMADDYFRDQKEAQNYGQLTGSTWSNRHKKTAPGGHDDWDYIGEYDRPRGQYPRAVEESSRFTIKAFHARTGRPIMMDKKYGTFKYVYN